MSVDNSMVSVDDTDPQITWSGPWFTTENNIDDLGTLGPPFLSTLHGISSNGSLGFSFYGRMVSVWGSLRPRNTSVGPDPNWQCIVDGQDIGMPLQYPSRPLSNYPLCWGRSLPEGNHTLQLNTVIQSEILYVDQVQYQAATNADIGSAWTEVRQRDGRIRYSVGWEEDDSGYRKWTYAPGAWLTYDFTGTDIIWGGYTPDSPGASSGLGQYMVDGKEPPTSFVIPSRSGSFTSQPYFNVTGLNPGPHRLQVTNAGDASTAALGLTYIYTKNFPADTPTPTRNSDSKKVIGGAVGGSIGAVLLICLGTMVFIRRRKRRSPNHQQEQEAEFSARGTTQVRPLSMVSGSTIAKDRFSPELPIQGTWGQVSNQLPNVPSAIFRNSTTSSALYGSNQPDHSTSVAPPSGPTTFVAPQPGPPIIPAPSGLHPLAPTPFATTSAQPYVQQMVWPTPRPTPVQHSQDGRPDEGDYKPSYR